MNERRKKIILSEIKYWKKNHLLPDHYCDFLSMLYAEGEESEANQVKGKTSVLHKEKSRKKWMTFIYISSAFMLLIASLKLWSLFFPEQPMILFGLLMLNCLMWLIMGRLLKLLYFTLSGLIGLVSILIFLFLRL